MINNKANAASAELQLEKGNDWKGNIHQRSNRPFIKTFVFMKESEGKDVEYRGVLYLLGCRKG